MFAHAAKRSFTNWFEIRRAISVSGNVLKASRIFSAILRRHQRFPPANPAAAQDDVLVVNNCGLSRCYSALRIVQSHPGAIVRERRDCRTRPGMIVSDLDRRFEWAAVA